VDGPRAGNVLKRLVSWGHQWSPIPGNQHHSLHRCPCTSICRYTVIKPPQTMRWMNLNLRLADPEPDFRGRPRTANTEF